MEDFVAFVAAGVTTFDTADIYGPSESLIGHYLKHHPAEKPHVQVRGEADSLQCSGVQRQPWVQAREGVTTACVALTAIAASPNMVGHPQSERPRPAGAHQVLLLWRHDEASQGAALRGAGGAIVGFKNPTVTRTHAGGRLGSAA